MTEEGIARRDEQGLPTHHRSFNAAAKQARDKYHEQCAAEASGAMDEVRVIDEVVRGYLNEDRSITLADGSTITVKQD